MTTAEKSFELADLRRPRGVIVVVVEQLDRPRAGRTSPCVPQEVALSIANRR